MPENGKTLPEDSCDCLSPTILERTLWVTDAIIRRVWEGNPEFSNRKWLLPCCLRRGFREQQKRVTWILWVLPRGCSWAVLCLVAQSYLTLCDPWTVAHQAPPSKGFSRQEYWSRLPVPTSKRSSQSRDRTQVSCIAGRFFTVWATREAQEHWSELQWRRLSLLQEIFPIQELNWESCIADEFFFTSWATREARGCSYGCFNPSPWEKQHGTSEMGLPVWMLITLHPKSAFLPNFPVDNSKSLHRSASLSGSLELKD